MRSYIRDHRRRPVKVADQHVGFNGRIALAITTFVGSMECSYLFAALAFSVLRQAYDGGPLALVQWFSQTFLQLVLLSIIMVGQGVQSKAADKRSLQTYEDAELILRKIEIVAESVRRQEAAIRYLGDHLELQKGS